ncbi:MAG: hypothetical protein QXQ18_02615 [Candidatus Aenigmatarchaeota archaeon]
MKFSEAVLTRSKKGKVEIRALDSRGRYVLTKYLDPETLKLADKKKKLTLKSDEGKIEEYFIIPLPDSKKALLIKAEKEEKVRKVWNEKTKREEDLF